ncbi:alanine:cation symporter family protein [Paenibacillus alvei]|uniref:Alanine:cation symporter family protein n=1 Tax=Paenibacillus alvei TaxID=44250 RepID=A0ABT4H6H0_PAEAL|nr:alanine/glycine:cation symporter family protein [Paenibacillus alvei]MCY9764576.1 alanine:cation symporter family protein [Paenibacillus alvei]MCY9766814.1 alanine:cation symporter family protein [Paenibacillus alvei]
MIDQIQDWIGKFNDLWYLMLIFVLVVAGLYFSLRTSFVQLSAIKETFRLILGRDKGKSSGEKQGVSSFQAFAMSTASRVGTGNLAGVAIAISLGGPGAVFWMWMIAIIGAASGFVESTLAQVYKVRDGKHFRGGPAYYMERALNARWLGIIFAILIIFSFGFVFNSVQANTASAAFQDIFNLDPIWMGIVLAILVIPTIFGGVQRVAQVTATVVPIMALAYMAIALFVMLVNFSEIPAVFASIIKNAFGFEEALAGGVGAAVMNGIKRGLFSNEAGMGSAPNAAATANVSHPVKQGLIQSFGVFVDTLLVCSSTAFIILFSGIPTTGEQNGIRLTQHALATQVGDWAHIFIGLAVFLFAFTSLIGNYYYGQSNIEFITKKKGWMLAYRLGVVAMVLFGSVAKMTLVWNLADLFMGFMAFINLISIMLLGKVAFAALKDYMSQRKRGEEPVFYADAVPGLKHAECWERNNNS